MIIKKILIPKIYLPIIYIIIAFMMYAILCAIVDKLLVINKVSKKKNNLQQKREKTIVNLIKSIIKYILAIIVILAILNVYGVKTTSILASLGIAGAIIGLAFQDTIKNLLSGITIIFDNHYMQGDYVTINGFKGEVIELGLQTTKIKSYEGEVMIINNSLVTSVINHSMYNKSLYIEFKVNKKVSIDKLESILKNVNTKLAINSEITKDMELLGIEQIDSNSYTYKVLIECKSEHHYSVKRKFMELLKDEYTKNNIEVPGEYLEVKKY